MDASAQIDQRIKELSDWRGKKISELRRIIHKADPEIEEGWKWGSPVFLHDELVCSLGSFSDHVKIHFFQGAKLKDSGKLFNAGLEAKGTRGIDIYEKDTIDENKLIILIKEAVEFNRNK